MARHQTKTKGDIGVAKVIADLAQHGIDIALPLSEHQPFDLIAILDNQIVGRVQVKYRTAKSNKTVSVRLAACASNSNGFYYKPIDRRSFDFFAIYCPDVNSVAYVPLEDVAHMEEFHIRLEPPKNNQRSGIRLWDHYRDPHQAFPGRR